MVQIETENALENLDEIFSVKGIGACFIGPWDLTMSLGIFRDFQHPKYENALDRVLTACRRWGVAPGIHCSEENINENIERGFQFCALANDYGFLLKGAREALKKVRGWRH